MRWESQGRPLAGHRPEYESIAATGSYCGIDDPEAIMTMNEICNRAGLDTISAGATIAFAMECYEHGLLSADQLDGLRLRWGDGHTAIDLLKRIVERRGLGDLLAEGVMRASQQIGKGSEAFAIHAGGQELPAHDPRQHPGLGLSYQISPTPGRHTQGGAGALDKPAEGEDSLEIRARGYLMLTAWNNVMNASGLCANGGYGMEPEHVPEFLTAVTGWDIDMAECLRTGERIEVLRHVFGLREGYNPLQTRVAPRALGYPPLESGPNAGVVVQPEGWRDAYLELMEWDPITAVPSRRRLAALELDDLWIEVKNKPSK
jgi:aldehyde:ferredoxin oxidoreductase